MRNDILLRPSYSLYANFFGQYSFKKYFSNGVIVVKYEEEPATIPPPAIIIFPINPNTGNGWKKEVKDVDEESIYGQFLAALKLVACIEGYFYSASDIIENIGQEEDSYMLPNLIEVKPFFMGTWNGLVYSVQINNDTLMSDNMEQTSDISLNETLSYTIFIMDKNMQFISNSPDVVPRFVLSLNPKAGTIQLYLKVIRHENLNQVKNPCEPSHAYNFGKCLEKSVITRIGCQPPLRRFYVDGMPLCNNVSLVTLFYRKFSRLSNLDRKKVFEETNCLMPCKFLEYKVKLNVNL